MASTTQRAFNDFAHTLCDDLTKGRVTLEQAYNRLKGFGYKVTDSGCFYRTFAMAGSRKGYYIHLWGTNMSNPGKPAKIRFKGIVWGDKDNEYNRWELHNMGI